MVFRLTVLRFMVLRLTVLRFMVFRLTVLRAVDLRLTDLRAAGLRRAVERFLVACALDAGFLRRLSFVAAMFNPFDISIAGESKFT